MGLVLCNALGAAQHGPLKVGAA